MVATVTPPVDPQMRALLRSVDAGQVWIVRRRTAGLAEAALVAEARNLRLIRLQPVTHRPLHRRLYELTEQGKAAIDEG
jgi:hypothetical protein